MTKDKNADLRRIAKAVLESLSRASFRTPGANAFGALQDIMDRC
jgi:hypothetical protein